MGGYGSGRQRGDRKEGTKRTVADLPALDVRILRREGRIADAQEELLVARGVRLGLAWTPSGFAGAGREAFLRPLFVCPGEGCERHAEILYLEEGRLRDQGSASTPLLCRPCLNLAYSSQRESELGRAMRKAQKARARLGNLAPDEDLPTEKPKHMHHRTFVRLGRKYLAAHQEHLRAFNEKWAAALPGLRESANVELTAVEEKLERHGRYPRSSGA